MRQAKATQLRITAQLVKVDDGKEMWSESYDRELKGVFALQEDIAKAIAGALRVPLGLKAGREPGCQPHSRRRVLSGLSPSPGAGAVEGQRARTGRAFDRGGRIAGTGCRPRSGLCPRLGDVSAGIRDYALLYPCIVNWRDR